MKKIHRITSASRPNRNTTTGEELPGEEQQINNSTTAANLSAGVNNISSLNVPLPLPLPLTSEHHRQTFNMNRTSNLPETEPSSQQPLSLTTKDMIPDRLSKDSDASQN